jgi:hypothetical protein
VKLLVVVNFYFLGIREHVTNIEVFCFVPLIERTVLLAEWSSGRALPSYNPKKKRGDGKGGR